MDFKTPKRKKFAPYCDLYALPIKSDKCYHGTFNGYNVTISDYDEMIDMYFMGNFGKGSLSKSAPNHRTVKDDLPELIFQQQWENQSKWNDNDKRSSFASSEKFLSFYKYQYEKATTSLNALLESVVNKPNTGSWDDSDSKPSLNLSHHKNLPKWISKPNDLVQNVSKDFSDDPLINLTENILKNKKILEINAVKNHRDDVIVVDVEECLDFDFVHAEIKKNTNLMKETLAMSLEETFFLSFSLGCLVVMDLKGVQLSVNDMWKKFSAAQDNFIKKYVAYHYYRSKGWTVKSGLKYGGDFLLYKKGPAYFHATYLVQVVDGGKKFSWNELLGMNRLVETFNKDLLLCYVIQPEDLTEDDSSNPEILKKFSVDECIVKRWLPTHERNVKN